MSTLPRGVCPVCGQERQLTKAGVMRYHRTPRDQYPFRGIVCKGVDQPPKSVAADPITAAEERDRQPDAGRDRVSGVHRTGGDNTMSAEQHLRLAIGVALIQSGYIDQDPETGDIDLLQHQPCPDCQTNGHKCACSGVPYLSDEIWAKIDKFGDYSAALKIERAAGWREAIEALRTRADSWTDGAMTQTAWRNAAAFLESLAPKETP